MRSIRLLLTLSVLLLLVSKSSLGQKTPERIIGSFHFDKRVFTYEFIKTNSSEFTFKLKTSDPKPAPDSAATDSTDIKDKSPAGDPKIVADTMAKVSEEKNEGKPEWQFASFSVKVFETIFLDQMKTVYKYPNSQSIKDLSQQIFYSIQAKLEFLDDEPVTANLILRDNYINSYLQSNGSNYYKGKLSRLIAGHTVSKVSVEIADGAIKNIKVYLVKPIASNRFTESPTQFLEFKNQYPISISGKFDAERLANVSLYSYNCNGEKGLTRYIRLSDLLLFDIILANDKEDYSPVNCTVLLTPDHPIVELKKEKRSKIITASAFTDFTGLDQEQPNGLIQIEASRKLNLNTRYRLLFGQRKKDKILSMVDLSMVEVVSADSSVYKKKVKELTYLIYKKEKKGEDNSEKKDSNGVAVTASRRALDTIKIKARAFHSPYVNFFGNLEPRLLFSKLEENNRFIDSGKVINQKIDPVLLYQYQLASFGAKLNVVKLSFPQLKVNWNVLYTGIYWFRTRLSTTTDTANKANVPLNSHYLLFGSNFVFNPDSRWGVTLGCDYIRPELWSPEYSLSSKKGLIQPYFDGHIKTNEDSKLFFRFRWTFERKNKNNNFTQIQMGYSLSLFSK